MQAHHQEIQSQPSFTQKETIGMYTYPYALLNQCSAIGPKCSRTNQPHM